MITEELRAVGEVEANTFAEWYARVEPRLRAALVAQFGPDAGRDAAAAALTWAWEHWDRLDGVSNPVAYLYRVGQSKARRRRHGWSRPPEIGIESRFEPGLPAALASLSDRQRSTVLLIHGYGWTLAETAEVLGITKSSVQTHLDRGLAALRERLGVTRER